MSGSTTNYGLILPSYNDTFTDVLSDINQNSSTIDTTIKQVSNAANASVAVTRIATADFITANTVNVNTSVDWYWFVYRYGNLMIVEGSFRMSSSPEATSSGGSYYIGTTTYVPIYTTRTWCISSSVNSSAEVTYGGVTTAGNVYIHSTATANKTYYIHSTYVLA